MSVCYDVNYCVSDAVVDRNQLWIYNICAHAPQLTLGQYYLRDVDLCEGYILINVEHRGSNDDPALNKLPNGS